MATTTPWVLIADPGPLKKQPGGEMCAGVSLTIPMVTAPNAAARSAARETPPCILHFFLATADIRTKPPNLCVLDCPLIRQPLSTEKPFPLRRAPLDRKSMPAQHARARRARRASSRRSMPRRPAKRQLLPHGRGSECGWGDHFQHSAFAIHHFGVDAPCCSYAASGRSQQAR